MQPPPPAVTQAAPRQQQPLAGISGTVAVSTTAQPEESVDSVLYIIVRQAGRASGAPVAVKRLPPSLPVSFEITEENAMIPGTPLIGPLDVIARLDRDGNAATREPGDLQGRVDAVEVGARVEITLDPVEDGSSTNGSSG